MSRYDELRSPLTGDSMTGSELLCSLADNIGDWHTLTDTVDGMVAWAESLHWPDTTEADRDVLLSQLALVMGQMLASEGRYAAALAVAAQGISHAGEQAVPMAQAALPWLMLLRTRIYLEMGEFGQVAHQLASVDLETGDIRRPALTRELAGSGGQTYYLAAAGWAGEGAFSRCLVALRDAGLRACRHNSRPEPGVCIYQPKPYQ